MLKGFKEFILRGNVVDLAIAVVIGSLFAAVVKAFVADILTPLIAAIGGQPNFSSLKFTLHHSTFMYGDLVNNLITFVSTAFVIYFLVVVPLNKINERRLKSAAPDPEPEEIAEDIALLTEIRDLLSGQRATSATPGTTSSVPGD